MADESTPNIEGPRKRQRKKGPREEENPPVSLNDPIKRATRACEQCRSQKKRCDSGQPCSTCKKGSLDCYYGTQAKKRGFPTGYVRILEALWGLVFQAVPTGEGTALQLLRQSSIGHDDEGKVILHNSRHETEHSTRQSWLNSCVRREIDKMATRLEDGQATPLVQDEGPSRSTPSLSTTTFFPPEFTPWDTAERALNRDHPSRQGEDSIAHDPSHHDLLVLPELHSQLPQPLPPDAWDLIEVYFRSYHCWLPLMPKYSVIRGLTQLLDGKPSNSGQPSVLWAIFSLTSAHRPDHYGETMTVSQKYYDEALKSIPSEPINLEQDHIQALVLLTVANMAQGNWDSASTTIHQAIRAIMNLRRSFPSQQRQSSTESLLNRSILAAFAIETLLAARLGTLPQLRSRDVTFTDLFDENDADEWEPFSTNTVDQTTDSGTSVSRRLLRSLSIFTQYIKLLSILNDSLCDLCSIKDYGRRLDDCQARLLSWSLHLPKHCQYSDSSMTETKIDPLPSAINLHLTAEAILRFLLARGDLTTNKTSQPPIHQDASILSVYKPAYQEAFGDSAWHGILDFHYHVTYLRRSMTQGQTAVFDRAEQPVTKQQQRPSLSQRPDTVPGVWFGREDVTESIYNKHGTTPAGGSSLAGDHAPISTDLTTGALLMEGDDATMMKSTTNDPFAAAIDAPIQLYNDPNDENSIENLLEELSAQQNVSWEEMEAQCMYNLGFMQGDQNLHG